MAGDASAQKWPSANAWERVETRTEVVRGVPFTVGSFSYWLRFYRAERVNESKTVSEDSFEWRRVIGPGTPSSEKPPRDSSRFFAPVAPLPALPPVDSSPRTIPALSALPQNAHSLTDLPPVPPLPALRR